VTILAAVAVLTLAILLAGTSGFFRIVAAVLMAVIILATGLRRLRRYRTLLPEPEPADVSRYDLRYRCTVCGLELKVEVATTDKPPTHCGEPMELIREGGRPPLHSVD
jgi:hypothetical protein